MHMKYNNYFFAALHWTESISKTVCGSEMTHGSNILLKSTQCGPAAAHLSKEGFVHSTLTRHLMAL